jgi:hypothetical protein
VVDIIASNEIGSIFESTDDPTILIVTPVDDVLSRIQGIEPSVQEVATSASLDSYDNITILAPGERGPRGPAGPPGTGSTSYTETISSPLAEWIINHNLDRNVSVEVTDLAGEELLCDVIRQSANQVRIVHSSPQAGVVIIT